MLSNEYFCQMHKNDRISEYDINSIAYGFEPTIFMFLAEILI